MHRAASLVAQGVYRVECCGAFCRVVPTQDASDEAKCNPNNDPKPRNNEGGAEVICDGVTNQKAYENAHQTTQLSNQNRFNKELHTNNGVAGSNGFSNANFTRTLGHAYEHDVHDAYAAHEQAYSCHRGQKGGHCLGRAAQGGRDLPGVEDVEVIVLIGLKVAPLSHERSDVSNERFAVRAVGG